MNDSTLFIRYYNNLVNQILSIGNHIPYTLIDFLRLPRPKGSEENQFTAA